MDSEGLKNWQSLVQDYASTGFQWQYALQHEKGDTGQGKGVARPSIDPTGGEMSFSRQGIVSIE